MQKTKEGCRWTIRLSNKDYAQKEVIRMFEYLLSTGEYATESDIFREGIKSLYREKTEPDRIMDWDNRIQECARITADNVLERMQTMLDATVCKGGLVNVAETVADADETVEADVGMAPPEAVEELSEEVDDFLNDFFGYGYMQEAIRNEQERMRLAESELRQSEKLAQHEEEHTTRTDASVLKEPVDEFEEALNNEYDMTFATKREQATVTSPDMDVINDAMDIRAKLICLEYEQEYNVNKISDLDYDIRYHNPNYQSYVENLALIRKKQSYIN